MALPAQLEVQQVTARQLPEKRFFPYSVRENRQADCGDSWSVATQLLDTEIRYYGGEVERSSCRSFLSHAH